jgi:hypothetical protein
LNIASQFVVRHKEGTRLTPTWLQYKRGEARPDGMEAPEADVDPAVLVHQLRSPSSGVAIKDRKLPNRSRLLRECFIGTTPPLASSPHFRFSLFALRFSFFLKIFYLKNIL